MTGLPPLRYLAGADVAAAMPPLPERLALAEQTLLGLAGAAELPPKIGVHPGPDGSFAHAMPAYLPGTRHGGADRLGMKWVLGFNTNNAIGLPAIHGILLLNDPATGVPTGILDAGGDHGRSEPRRHRASRSAPGRRRSTAGRRGPRSSAPASRAAATCRSWGTSCPAWSSRSSTRDPDRAARLAATARETTGIRAAEVAPSARDAVDGADVVVSAAAFLPPAQRQSMTNDWLAPEALVVPIDYATYCAAEVARDAALFLVDHRDQFLANRDAGQFDGLPGSGLRRWARRSASGRPRPGGRVVATHLGTGLADVVFGTAILEAAAAMGLGTELPR